MGNGVSGGQSRSTLAGTFLAEQTHQQPPKYTLVSVSSAIGPDGCPRHMKHNGVSAQQGNASRRFGAGGAAQVTVLPALSALEPLLTVEEQPLVKQGPSGADKNGYRSPSKAGTKDSKQENTPPAPSTGTAAKGSRGGRGGRGAGSGRGRGRKKAVICGEATDPETERSEMFTRLAAGGPQPWVATQSDTDLLTYLAQRGKDPSLIRPGTSSTDGGNSLWSSPSPSRRKHETRQDLFDSCLRQDQLRSPDCLSSPSRPGSRMTARTAHSPTRSNDKHYESTASSRGGRSSPRRGPYASREDKHMGSTVTTGFSSTTACRLYDLIEEIPVLPEDPVAHFFANEADRRSAAAKTAAEAQPSSKPAIGAGKGTGRTGRGNHDLLS
eukprot:TRINITY_DN707_c5_g1_i1.p1 TRINITY_DN707_c5_g1~~TRINITY_DN707_c5_g1_i1.p1  ORF type:complete len:382 (+),score=49.09 TRINITY_DN707_c5_g1_i1:122-1267(+)